MSIFVIMKKLPVKILSLIIFTLMIIVSCKTKSFISEEVIYSVDDEAPVIDINGSGRSSANNALFSYNFV